MSVIVLLLCILVSAFFHQALYFVIPLLSIYHLSYRKDATLRLNPVLKLYLSVVVAVVSFFVIQSLLGFEIKFFSLKGIARYVTYFLFAALVFSFDNRSIGQVFRLLILYLVLTLPLGVYQVIAIDRYQNIFSHANHLAYVLAICMYFLIFHRPFDKWFRLVALFCLVISLLLTKSSGGILVVLCLLGYNMIVSKRISLNKKLMLFGSFLVIALLAFKFSEKVSSQIASLDYLNWDFLEDRVRDFRGGGYGSLIWRIIYWTKILFTFLMEPFHKLVFGIGVDSLTEGNMPYTFMKRDPHNDFIKVLVEFGFLGLLLFLGFFKKIYSITHRNFNILILIAIPMFFGNVIVNFPYNIAFILLIAYEYNRITAPAD